MLVDSKKTKLGVEAIIVASAAETNSKYPVATVYAAVVKEMSMKGTFVIQEGNTLFIIHHVSSRVGFFRALNADVAMNYFLNANEFMKAAYKLGYDELYTQFNDPSIFKLLEVMMRYPPNKEMDYVAEERNGRSIVHIYIGPAREREKPPEKEETE
jgi:hypothetical protein